MYPAFTFKIGGEAGFGVMSAGLVFSKIATRSGYHVFCYSEYPSIIRGGHNVMQVSVSDEPVTSQFKQTNFLLALNQETLNLHATEMVVGSGILYDPENVKAPSTLPKGVEKFEIPLLKIVREIEGSFVMRNTVAMGATVALLGGDMKHLKDMVHEEFGDKTDLVEKNYRACDLGYEYAMKNYANQITKLLVQKPNVTKKMVLTANESVAIGAIAAGVNFVSVYPMTPTSNIMHNMAPLQQKYNFIYKQPEDEISAINMAIGASFAGARTMVATAGGGFSLMAEGYGLAGITETPIVIIEGMRPGPATGLPTWTSQGDLRFVLHAHQDDFPRIILAASDVDSAFKLTMQAFNLSEKYQTPVVVLVDKYICESQQSTDFFDISDYKVERGKITFETISDYQRYKLSDDGISMRTVPGMGNFILANSDEHNETGYSNEESENRIAQMNKRMKKLETCAKQDMSASELFGPQNADLTIVSWGSNKGPILEALKQLPNVNYLHLTWVNPFPTEQVLQHLNNAKQLLNIECNYTGQMQGIIKERTGVDIKNNFLKFDGRPFYPEEIIEKAKQLL